MVSNVKKILEEASVGGITAREEMTKVLTELAKWKNWGREDICGLCWLEVDRGTCRWIQALEMAGVKAYATDVGFRVRLDAVEDHQRFCASMAGLEAAAEVFKNHGIQAEACGMAD